MKAPKAWKPDRPVCKVQVLGAFPVSIMRGRMCVRRPTSSHPCTSCPFELRTTQVSDGPDNSSKRVASGQPHVRRGTAGQGGVDTRRAGLHYACSPHNC